MRHDQLLPVQPGETRDAYVRRMADEYRRNVGLDELVDCAKSWWDVQDRQRKKVEILALLENPYPQPYAVAHLLRRVILELL